ncbi:NADH:ubiquinone oxidoreductase [Tulasnella sp. 424]|nr:NADH:ubiquinone oxidoreductase [Tulasnella sp. 424]KAG8971562.1 NADH:ubiquinone oxidoreductase [Tulasnella sp. 425]
MSSIFDGEGDISVSEDDSQAIDWHQKYEQVKELLDLARDELDEFQASSQELEEELEKELQRTERAQRELEDQVRRLEVDRDNWQAKFIQSNDLVNKLQLELTAVRQTIATYKSQVVELEMGNDDLERNERAAAESLKELESQFNRIMEEKILLEGEVGEKRTLSEENQRLRDANSDLQNEIVVLQRKVSRMPVITTTPVVTSSPLSTAAPSPVVPRDLELKDIPPSPTTSILSTSTSSRLPQRQQSLRPQISFVTATASPQPRPPPPSRGLSMVNDMRNKTRALQTKIGVGLPKIRPRLNSITRAVAMSTSSSKSAVPASPSMLGFGGKENQRHQQHQPHQPPRPRQSLDSTRSVGSSNSSKSPGWVVVQTEEEEEENQVSDTRKTPRAPRTKDVTVTTPTPLQSRARAMLRPRRSDSDTSRPEITPFRLGNFGLAMRSGSRTSGRSSLSSASEAESGNERFGSVGKIGRLSFASESDSDLEAILKIRDSTDTVKATPKAKPRSSVPSRTMPRDDSAILMPPPSSFPQRGFKPDESSDAPPESPLSPDLDGDLRSSTGSVASSTSSKSSVKTKVVGAMTKYLHSSASRAATVPQSQVSGDSKNEIKFPSRLGHKRSQSTLPTASPRPYSPAPSAIPAYTRRTSTDAVRVLTNSTPSTNPLRSSVPLKYAGLPAAIPLEASARSLSTSSSSGVSPTSYYHSGSGEHRRVSGGDAEP